MRILFVDDESRVLDGLRRMLRGQRHEWEMQFATGGEEALRLLASESFDVVVSDMRMPGMDGAELLGKVRVLHPKTIRLVLSGHAETDAVMRALGVTHQYLAKPCDAEQLKQTIARALHLQEVFGTERVRAVVGRMAQLPSLPAVFQELVACLQNPDATLEQVGQIIGKDVAMTAKILQLVNSAYFGLSRQVTSVERAASLLGLDTLSSLVLSHGIFAQLPQDIAAGFSVDRLWRHSFTVGAIARAIGRAEALPRQTVDELFLSALLHDVGKLILATELPDQYAEVVRRSEQDDDLAVPLERELVGATHCEIGAYLLSLWGLPDSVVAAVLNHDCPEPGPPGELPAALIVHAADRIAHEPELADPAAARYPVGTAALAAAGVLDHWSRWQAEAAQVLGGAEEAA